MKTILTELGRSLVATLFFAVVLCGLYPLIVYGVSQLLFPNQANGSLLLDRSGEVRGSALLAQNFTSAKYFHPRPSAASAGDPTSAVSVNNYDATHSGGSNLGPTSSNLVANVAQNIATCRSDNGLATNAIVPADAATASGSGLDPDISPANAGLQIPRVARARGLSEDRVRNLVKQNTSGRDLGLFGEPRVNVMTLNFALDQLPQK
jgi:potassium-transporting ATPase KdpC subunit